jgi:hypothetical protein
VVTLCSVGTGYRLSEDLDASILRVNIRAMLRSDIHRYNTNRISVEANYLIGTKW